MPKIIDENERRRLIAEAVWTIAAEQGLDKASIRAVATKSGLSVGSIQHSFHSQEDLRRFAMELVVNDVTKRLSIPRPTGKHSKAEHIVELLLETLPLDSKRLGEARIWAAFSTAALFDLQLAPYNAKMNSLLHEFCHACVTQLGGSPSTRDAQTLQRDALCLQALLDGLTVNLLADSSPSNRRLAESVLRAHIHSLL